MNIPEDASGVSIKAFEFNGDATKFRIWEGKTLALTKTVLFTTYSVRYYLNLRYIMRKKASSPFD